MSTPNNPYVSQPTWNTAHININWDESVPSDDAMTLRDYFAGQALIGIYCDQQTRRGDEQINAVWAYEIADAMLIERSKETEE